MPRCYWKVDSPNSFGRPRAVHMTMSWATDTLVESAFADALDDDFKSCERDLLTLVRMANHEDAQPAMEAGILASNRRQMVALAAWKVVRIRPEPVTYKMAERVVDEIGAPRSPQYLLQAQFVESLRIRGSSNALALRGVLGRTFVDDVAYDWWLADQLRRARIAYQAMAAKPQFGLQAKMRLDQSLTGVDPQDREWLRIPISTTTRQLAVTRLVRLGVALMRARDANSKFPRALPDLGDQTIDPFTDKPFLYESTGNGFTVSLGRWDGKPRSPWLVYPARSSPVPPNPDAPKSPAR
ncbi:MAG: hypothetical protein HYR64_00295 [Fimbriimonas ginsengisoli]|uniref:Uncharacterized protein n=1 Tax=Fimbriimonas ginsengisoli TaxID=1005039 RepID=A0A931LVA4_FIMGI|nr:hypothetical protein [Fimbriimonas ginsengisoli]